MLLTVLLNSCTKEVRDHCGLARELHISSIEIAAATTTDKDIKMQRRTLTSCNNCVLVNAFPKNNRLDQEKVHENSAISDVRKTSEYRFNLNNPRLIRLESLSSSSGSSPTQIDPVIDYVGDCEIPWEDLVIGEK
ncbi:Armadillo repeat-containing protein 3 and Serine/threonine-protein kinase CTR1 [Artemisia annua]|uniref:Armadillo repeat-containing protein 3 and Serine/threonine-protein kinase CTR1 n=1 Tax=Artemisia annua TaxID=35608 RepID=A0A2U1MGW8_ARTAN|nr:Armadillo repeat-containing protein 3 and Serine/threonine-protein kinase CTR1 [Artemisia annua]